jgi:hypothetical protein
MLYSFYGNTDGFAWEQPGGVSERFKEPVLKTGDSKEPWVRIPPPPPKREKLDTKCGEMAEPVEGGRLLSD